MSYFTILKRTPTPDRLWQIVMDAVEADTPDEAMELLVNEPDGGAGEYMLVEVKALRRVRAETTYEIEPMAPPGDE